MDDEDLKELSERVGATCRDVITVYRDLGPDIMGLQEDAQEEIHSGNAEGTVALIAFIKRLEVMYVELEAAQSDAAFLLDYIEAIQDV